TLSLHDALPISEHGYREELEGQILKDARAREQLRLERVGLRQPLAQGTRLRQILKPERPAQHQPVEEEAADEEDEPDDERAEDGLEGVGVQKRHAPARDYLVQVAVAVEDHAVVIPGLPRPEPNPPRPAYEGADDDQDDPHE